jgi:hypothetical protein
MSIHGTRTDFRKNSLSITARTLGIHPDILESERKRPNPQQLQEMSDVIEKLVTERGKLLLEVSSRIDHIQDLTTELHDLSTENTTLRDMIATLERELHSRSDGRPISQEEAEFLQAEADAFAPEEFEERDFVQEEYAPEEHNPEEE